MNWWRTHEKSFRGKKRRNSKQVTHLLSLRAEIAPAFYDNEASSRWSRCLKPPSHLISSPACLFSLLFIPLCASTYVYCSRALTLEGGIWLLCLSPLHIHPPTDRPTDPSLVFTYFFWRGRRLKREDQHHQSASLSFCCSAEAERWGIFSPPSS